MRFATRAVHSGQISTGDVKSVSPPIFQSSTYEWSNVNDEPAFNYSRYQNPNRQSLEETVAELEGGRYAVGFGSGMAAIAAAFGIAKAGDHILVASDIYGGTVNYARQVLPDMGIEVGRFDALEPDSILLNAQPNTRLLIFETPTNPTLRVADIQAICDEAHQMGLTTIVDNTFATPCLQNPLALGADVVVHSATKYLGGHSDVVLGVAVTSDIDLQSRLYRHARVSGAVPSPFDCWLVQRGIRTLAARMRVAQENATAIAEFLSSHSRVHAVHYPGLDSHPGHDLAKRQMRGFGAMLAAEIGDFPDDFQRFVEKLKIFAYAASLGSVESLVSWPPALSHASLSEEERLASGIKPNLIRFSIGLEDTADLLEDIRQALEV